MYRLMLSATKCRSTFKQSQKIWLTFAFFVYIPKHRHISEWIENFDELSVVMKDHAGYQMQLDLDGKRVDLTCTMSSLTIAGQPITVIRLMNSHLNRLAATNGTDTDGGVGNLKNELPMQFYIDVSKQKKEKKPPATGKGAAGGKRHVGTEENDIPAREDAGVSTTKSKKKAARDDGKLSPGRQASKTRRESIRPLHDAMVSDNRSGSMHTGDSKLNHFIFLALSAPSGMSAERRPSTVPEMAVDQQSAHPTSFSQASTTLNRMMRTTFAKKIEVTSVRLRSMRKLYDLGEHSSILNTSYIIAPSLSLVLLFTATTGFAIAYNVIFGRAYAHYQANVEDVVVSGHNYVDVIVLLQKLRLLELDCLTMSTGERETAKTEILDFAEAISDNHYGLYARSSYLSAASRLLFTAPVVGVAGAADPASTTVTKISLNDAINMLVSRASLLATNLEESVCTTTDTIEPVSSIVFDSLIDPLRSLIDAYLDANHEDIVRLRSTLYWFAVAPIVAIYIVCVSMILLIFRQTNSEAKVLYRLFLDVPKVWLVDRVYSMFHQSSASVPPLIQDVIASMRDGCVQKLAVLGKNTDTTILSAQGSDRRQNTQFVNIFNYQTYLKDASGGHGTGAVEGEDFGSTSSNSDGYEFVNLKKVLLRYDGRKAMRFSQHMLA